MYKNLRWKFLVIGAIIAIAVVAITPPHKKIKKGLDLQGGLQLVMQVVTDDALRVETDTSIEQLKEALKSATPAPIAFSTMKVNGVGEFQVEGIAPANEQQFRTIATQLVGATFERDSPAEGISVFKMKANVARDHR